MLIFGIFYPIYRGCGGWLQAAELYSFTAQIIAACFVATWQI